MLEFIKPDWPAPPWIQAYSTTRRGGISLPPFEHLNISLHVGDNPEHVIKNRQLLQEKLIFKKVPHWLNQIHSNLVVSADNIPISLSADAIYSREAQTVCAVQTADCLPLLVCSRTHHCVAAIHAGWRGLSQNIIENTIHTLARPASDLLVWLGPAIGPKAFIVGEEVLQAFLGKDVAEKTAFYFIGKNRWQANLYQLARQRLHRLKINAIYGGNYCTYSDPRYFFSFRREKITGRMVSLIWIDD